MIIRLNRREGGPVVADVDYYASVHPDQVVEKKAAYPRPVEKDGGLEISSKMKNFDYLTGAAFVAVRRLKQSLLEFHHYHSANNFIALSTAACSTNPLLYRILTGVDYREDDDLKSVFGASPGRYSWRQKHPGGSIHPPGAIANLINSAMENNPQMAWMPGTDRGSHRTTLCELYQMTRDGFADTDTGFLDMQADVMPGLNGREVNETTRCYFGQSNRVMAREHRTAYGGILYRMLRDISPESFFCRNVPGVKPIYLVKRVSPRLSRDIRELLPANPDLHWIPSHYVQPSYLLHFEIPITVDFSTFFGAVVTLDPKFSLKFDSSRYKIVPGHENYASMDYSYPLPTMTETGKRNLYMHDNQNVYCPIAVADSVGVARSMSPNLWLPCYAGTTDIVDAQGNVVKGARLSEALDIRTYAGILPTSRYNNIETELQINNEDLSLN